MGALTAYFWKLDFLSYHSEMQIMASANGEILLSNFLSLFWNIVSNLEKKALKIE